MVVLHWKSFLMLDTLFKRYKSNRQNYSLFYEEQLFQYRNKPINILQVGVENSIPAFHRFLQRSNIYCIDEFDKQQPDKYQYLNDKRIFWSRCDTSNQKSINAIMKDVWNKPRFDVVIDNVNNFAHTRHEYLKRYCIGKYYIEDNDEVKVIK